MSADLVVGVLMLIAAIVGLTPPLRRSFFAWAFFFLLAAGAWMMTKSTDREDVASAAAYVPVPVSRAASTQPAAPRWHDEDEQGHPYHVQTPPFRPSENIYRRQRSCGGNTPCDDWRVTYDAKHPVNKVICRTTAEYEEVVTQRADGNSAICEGWIDGGDGLITMDVWWRVWR